MYPKGSRLRHGVGVTDRLQQPSDSNVSSHERARSRPGSNPESQSEVGRRVPCGKQCRPSGRPPGVESQIELEERPPPAAGGRDLEGRDRDRVLGMAWPWAKRKPPTRGPCRLPPPRSLRLHPRGHRQGRGTDSQTKAIIGAETFRADILASGGLSSNLAQHGSLSHSWVQGQGDALPTVALLQGAYEVNVASLDGQRISTPRLPVKHVVNEARSKLQSCRNTDFCGQRSGRRNLRVLRTIGTRSVWIHG